MTRPVARTGPPSDREVLRQACREGLPCAIVTPGRPQWGRSILLALREGGPRPQLAVAQPLDATTNRIRSLGSGETVRVFGSRDGEPWHFEAWVESHGVVEGPTGPVNSAILRLPWRLNSAERRLLGPAPSDRPRLAVELLAFGPADVGTPRTLLETWTAPDGISMRRGEAHLVELSRRTASFSLPRTARLWLLPGARVLLSVSLPDLALHTDVVGRVEAVLPQDDVLLHGLSLFEPEPSISADEHREVIRATAEAIA